MSSGRLPGDPSGQERGQQPVTKAIDLFAELRDVWNEAVSTQLLSAAATDVEQALRYGQRAVQLFEEAEMPSALRTRFTSARSGRSTPASS